MGTVTVPVRSAMASAGRGFVVFPDISSTVVNELAAKYGSKG